MIRVGRCHPVQWAYLCTGAHPHLTWFTIRLWKWELDARWYH